MKVLVVVDLVEEATGTPFQITFESDNNRSGYVTNFLKNVTKNVIIKSTTYNYQEPYKLD